MSFYTLTYQAGLMFSGCAGPLILLLGGFKLDCQGGGILCSTKTGERLEVGMEGDERKFSEQNR